ncbi:serine protease 33-like [Trichogramma pretiosum]|uniref:serine protease 33-like n=1 Tax=Trichogramma pretiosum TaxID=7493 RepID=UPI0006C9C132|nr:serine protease 33-like [Trichogramma pretiosum]
MSMYSGKIPIVSFCKKVFEGPENSNKIWMSDVSCGSSSSSSFNAQTERQARIVGGENAVPREFPWLVSITRKGGHFCGGSIINSKFVLTAAHCFCSRNAMMPVKQLRITLGEHDLQAPEEPRSLSSGVDRLIVHEDFECGKWSNDIALLELSSRILWSDSVKPACLPASDAPRSFEGEPAVAAGWGWLGEDMATAGKASILQKVDVNVIEDRMCSQWYASQGKSFRVKYGQMCAGHEFGGRDACGADSGGPLMYSSDNKIIVIGIVSSGIGCARKRLPGIYTRVSEFVPWIVKNLRGG